MNRKLTTALVALAAFVVLAVVPAVSSATELTYPTGTRMPINTKIRAHNVGNTLLKAGTVTVTCTNAAMTGTLEQNNGTTASGTIESASFKGLESEERCSSGFLGPVRVTITSLPWCLKTTGGDNFEVRGGRCSEATRALTFILDSAIGECKYSRANVSGTFTTHPEDAKLTVNPTLAFALEAGSAGLCPGSGTLEMTFTLEHDSEGTQPIYIS
jgi:hypothetical protein